MSGNDPKPTAATLDNLKSALGDLQALQSTLTAGKHSQSLDKLPAILNIKQDIKDLLNNAADRYDMYYNSRAAAVNSAITDLRTGVGTLVSLLQATITNYDINEQYNQGAADNTGSAVPSTAADGKG
jgi:hypothetical protein